MNAPKHTRIRLHSDSRYVDFEIIDEPRSRRRSEPQGSSDIVSLFLFLVVFIGGLAATSAIGDPSEAKPAKPIRQDLTKVAVMGSRKAPALSFDDSHVLWLARVIYSETSIPEQAEVIGWVTYWRWRTGYRGASTLWGVIHDKAQFSAFLDADLRARYGALGFDSKGHVWQETLKIARDILETPAGEEKLGPEWRHFHHEQADPSWAKPRPDLLVEGPGDYPDLLVYQGIS